MRRSNIPLIFRLYTGAIFTFFAFIPGWIIFQLAITFVKEPASLVWPNILLFVGSSAFLYLFCLLGYRALTGTGRAKDDGLLPPWVMKTFAHTFGIVAVLIVGFGIYKKEIWPILGGVGYLVAALTVIKGYKRRSDNGT